MLGTPVSIQTLMQCNIGPGQYQVLEWVATWEILVQLAWVPISMQLRGELPVLYAALPRVVVLGIEK